jgi:hypothetical protein
MQQQYQAPQQQYYNAGATPQPYQQPMPQYQQTQPAPMPQYQQPVQPQPAAPQQQFDPITGRPIIGTVMGI